MATPLMTRKSVSNIETIWLTDGKYHMIKEELEYNEISFIGSIISNLLNSRDYLGLELNLECGNITEREFEELEANFLREVIVLSLDDLKKKIDILVKLTGRVYDAEEISTMFNTSIEIAEHALTLYLKDV